LNQSLKPFERIFLLVGSTIVASHFLVNEDGPADIFRSLREIAGIIEEREEINGETIYTRTSDNSFTAKAISCELCMSVYSSAILALLPNLILIPLGVAGWAVAFFLWLKGRD